MTILTAASAIFAQTAPPIEPGVSQTLAKWRAANYSDVRYKLNITLEKGAPLMKGEIEVRVKLTEAGAKNDLILDWRTTQFAGDKDKPYAYATELNGYSPARIVNEEIQKAKDNAFAPIVNEHLILPKELLKKGENVVKIEFASPIKTSGAGITRYIDKEDAAEYVYSLFVPSDASTAFPVFDQPDLKARFQLNVNAPGTWKVISNTTLSNESNAKSKFLINPTGESLVKNPSGDGVYLTVFAETKPISTYVFAFAAGNFVGFSESLKGFYLKTEDIPDDDAEREKLFESIKSTVANDKGLIYVRRSQAEKFKQHAAETFRLNREAVKYLESYFDYKFPFPKYDLVLLPEFPFGGMEHAGATFLREDRVIFPTEPTKNDFVTRANLIFHEAAHQWFGDTVTMRWFDDLWLKEGFAEFMAYKTLEKVMPEYNAWKIFYERNKQAAYLTDSTKGTTPIYQEIPNLSAAKSAYGNIVYRKAPSFLKQAEFYLGADKFQTAVRAFLKKHEFKNAEWTDLVKEFETASGQDLKDWANVWVTERGMPIFRTMEVPPYKTIWGKKRSTGDYLLIQKPSLENSAFWKEKTKVLIIYKNDSKQVQDLTVSRTYDGFQLLDGKKVQISDGKVVQTIEGKTNVKSLLGLVNKISFVFPNYQDYGYGIFLLDEKSRDYVLGNIQNERDDFLRTMMWGALWDSVRETELAPADYVRLVIKNINVEGDESTIQTLLGRVSTAMNYYLSDKQREELAEKVENVLIDKMRNAPNLGQRITFYRAFLNLASSDNARAVLKEMLKRNAVIPDGTERASGKVVSSQTQDAGKMPAFQLRTKDRFDIVARLLILNDKDAPQLLAALEKTETSDEAKRYAYAARAGIATQENAAKFFNDFVNNKDISESYIESAFAPFNAPRRADLTLPYLEKALAELPSLKRNRKIFFVGGWLGAFIGGQQSEQALQIVNKFLADNPNLDKDLRLKVLENADGLERAVKIRQKYGK